MARNDISATPLQYVRIMRKKAKHDPGWFVKEWLLYKGLRQSDIVSRTPFGKGMVSEYVNGKRRWNRDVLEQFAHAIGVDMGDLLKPPPAAENNTKNELAEFVARMDEKVADQALRLLKALEPQDKAA